MSVFSFEVYPKVNVFLKILGLQQGYHTLISRLVLLKDTFRDHVSVKLGSAFSLRGNFNCPLQSNTIFKMLQVLRAHLQAKQVPQSLLKTLDKLDIEVEKHIPIQAGLGGGSADAGVLLNQLNTHLDLGLSLEDRYELGTQVGSDVNFFISGLSSAHVYGHGQRVCAFEELPLQLEIFSPQIACQSARVYEAFDQGGGGTCLEGIERMSSPYLLQTYSRVALNDLLAPALKVYPELKRVESQLSPRWFFSGSGSSFFALRSGL